MKRSVATTLLWLLFLTQAGCFGMKTPAEPFDGLNPLDAQRPGELGGEGELPRCDQVDPGMPCCGDDLCDGPETEANCPADCAGGVTGGQGGGAGEGQDGPGGPGGGPRDNDGGEGLEGPEEPFEPVDPADPADPADPPDAHAEPSFPIVDTGQSGCYDATGAIPCPAPGAAFAGQDAQHLGLQPAYQDNGDGTVTDLRTGLMWVQDPGAKVVWEEALAGAVDVGLGGHDDWRLPTIKELYSLIDFDGGSQMSVAQSVPYIDTRTFGFTFGDESAGERLIDAQFWSATEYLDTTMWGNHTVFGVNFADGRIKGYGSTTPRGPMRQFVRYVRGNPAYGLNDFSDQGDATVLDRATGLLWQRSDSGATMDWEAALAHCEQLDLAGAADWRLPNAKELQSIVDYGEAPGVTGSPAIDPVFDSTDREGWLWTSTSHLEGPPDVAGSHAVYVAFGRATGWMDGGGGYELLDVHGAGAQRSDPKTGDPADYPYGHGPQGDVIRIFNYVRCVRGGASARYAVALGCGDGVCASDETGRNCPDDCGALTGGGGQPPDGPAACAREADCLAEGMCPPDALGCTCAPLPMGGQACVPTCRDDADCPASAFEALVCGPRGLCVPGR